MLPRVTKVAEMLGSGFDAVSRHRQLVGSGYSDAGEWQWALGFIANPCYRFRPRPEIFGSSKLYALRQ